MEMESAVKNILQRLRNISTGIKALILFQQELNFIEMRRL